MNEVSIVYENNNQDFKRELLQGNWFVKNTADFQKTIHFWFALEKLVNTATGTVKPIGNSVLS